MNQSAQSAHFDLTSSETAHFDLTSSVFKANQYPIFARLRVSDPVYQYDSSSAQQSTWLVTRYTDAEIVLRDERFVKDRQNILPPEERQPALNPLPSADDLFDLGMLKFDPPEHTRLRKLIMPFFSARAIEHWKESIQQITDELIDTVRPKGYMDLVEEFAAVLPIRMIASMLGVPAQDSAKLHLWTKRIADALDDPSAFQQVHDDLQAFYLYLRVLIEQKRREPDDGLVSKLLQGQEGDDKLTERELVAMVFLLILAGHETTTNLIGNGILALLTHPEQLRLLQERPELITTAVDEFLRYFAPFAITTHRWAREDVELADKQIKRGDVVLVSLASVNRDEEVFGEAEELKIERKENHHLSFGKGMHYCLGAHLAKLEGRIAIGTLLRRLPDLRLQGQPEDLTWRAGSTVLGVEHLPVTF